MFLNIKNATIGYTSPLIRDVNAGLDTGEICLLIGNNGAGKTTLIKSILHQIPLLGGGIFLDNKPVEQMTSQEIAEKSAVVFSKADIPANYTVYDLVALGKFIHYPYYFELRDEDKAAVSEIIENLGLQVYRDYPLNRLSDGNLQKAFIGRALAQNAPMIILDEPTTHLDEENKIMILKLLRNLARTRHKLILFSSHDWRLAKEFSDKIWLVRDQQLTGGITEDVLIRNRDLIDPHLFHVNDDYVAPAILAPDAEKEMLYSFLQKNMQKDLSAFTFQFQDGSWFISGNTRQQKCNSFAEIAKLLQNHDGFSI
ncbi:ABC transporter ATP-binding protein [Chryseobacterium sp. MFBS3-17]|uniref:ABC transporter ATP-binding protein n=1 Tax=Chryseobacterium sp. MFBS3-17 TaxID=2886689 RepID=UPI001D0EDC74|nr:ABC transporter ATP-binding protein [Chryseobacterium sp. MFBS3-17]MCC2591706.1 ABC transporter ATP-binding protein [Chryseobacterium sp. MFBS3-17]